MFRVLENDGPITILHQFKSEAGFRTYMAKLYPGGFRASDQRHLFKYGCWVDSAAREWKLINGFRTMNHRM